MEKLERGRKKKIMILNHIINIIISIHIIHIIYLDNEV
jgi:hypothetical protein